MLFSIRLLATLALLPLCALLSGCLTQALGEKTGYFTVEERLGVVREVHLAEDGSLALRIATTVFDAPNRSIRHERFLTASPEAVAATVAHQPAGAIVSQAAPGESPVVRLKALPVGNLSPEAVGLAPGYPGGADLRWQVWPDGVFAEDPPPGALPPSLDSPIRQSWELPLPPKPGPNVSQRPREDPPPLVPYTLPDGRRVLLDFSGLRQPLRADFRLGRTAAYVALVPFAAAVDVVGYVLYFPFRWAGPIFFVAA